MPNITVHVSKAGKGCKVDRIDPPSAPAVAGEVVTWTVVGEQGVDTVTIHEFTKNGVKTRPLPLDPYEIEPNGPKTIGDPAKADARGTYKYKVKTPNDPDKKSRVDPEIQIGG